jgi:hypothetical protein
MSGEEDRKGTLSVGKWADLAMLSDDYFSIPEERISQTTSVLTMVGGRVVYGAAEYAALAPAALPVAPGWLPIATYPGYSRAAERAGDTRTASSDGTALAAATIAEAMPTVVGADGRTWTMGCGCGLL